MLIEAENVSRLYGSGSSQVAALQEVSLTIRPGDFLSIMGPSGSGKSTLLHLLSGLDRPTSGRLLYDGQDIYGLRDRELSAFRRSRIGFIFQQFHLPVLTAQENILMPLLLSGGKAGGQKRGRRAAAENGSSKEAGEEQDTASYLAQLTDLLGIGDRLTHLPHELSGGQQQRGAIARALIARPDIIFADEPTGNLDSKSGGEVMRMLEEIHHQFGKTLVVITHDSRIARRASRQFVIVDGRLSEVSSAHKDLLA